jgi:hypothetical protein
VAFVSGLCKGFQNDLDWWLEAPASRNSILSRLFHDCAAFVLLDDLLRRRAKINAILVDTPELYSVACDAVARTGRTIPVHYGISAVRRRTGVWRARLSPLRSIGRLFLEWLLVRASRWGSVASPPREDALILIDTFLLPGHVERDRYYPGLWEAIPAASRSLVRFVPQFSGFSLAGLWRAARMVRMEPGKYLCKEDCVNLRDFIWCSAHWIRVRRLRLAQCHFRGVEMSRFLRAELRRAGGFRCAVRGLINYRFARGVKNAGARVVHAIDWYENHPMDRGWNAGFKEFFPTARTTGYQGFYASFPAARPAVHEYRANLVPDEVAIMGPCFQKDVTEFFPDCKVVTAPAFRYQCLADGHDVQPGVDSRTVLVALPYDAVVAEFILSLLCLIRGPDATFEFVVKAHPATSLKLLNGTTKNTAKPIRKVSGALESWYPRVVAMITGGAATTLIEAVAYGVPVVVVVPPGRRNEVSVPAALPAEMVQVCEDQTDVTAALTRFQRMSIGQNAHRRYLAGEVRRRCFTPVTPEAVARFLGVDDGGRQLHVQTPTSTGLHS